MKQVERSDPGNQYGVIYQWGTIGIGINAEKIKALMPDAPLDSFKLIFDPALARSWRPAASPSSIGDQHLPDRASLSRPRSP